MPLEQLPGYVVEHTLTSIVHNWPFLLFGILTAAMLKVYVGTDRVASLLRRRTDVAVAGSVAVAVGTPFCSCGTTAVVISMLAASVPWAPIVAFMVASPLSSPDGFVISAGLFGWPFATYLVVSSIVLGVAGGVVAYVFESAGLLDNQARFADKGAASSIGTAIATAGASCGSDCGDAKKAAAPVVPAIEPVPVIEAAPACGCGSVKPGLRPSIGPGAASVAEFRPLWIRWRFDRLWSELRTGAPQLILMFVGFAAIGYLVIGLVPTEWMTSLLGGSSPLSVVAAATAGLPFYLTDGSLPLVASLRQGGMGAGPAMAFLITGAGTSVGALSGGLLIARWRVLAIVVGTLWVGAIVLGLVAQAIL
jgi:uncharacterized membrane protein YraQ (UPF0718 family)